MGMKPTPSVAPSRATSIGMLLVAVAIWGVNYLVVKIGVSEWQHSPFVAVRFWIATASFMPLISWSRLTSSLRDRRFAVTGLLAGACLFIAYITQALALGVGHSTPSNAAFLTALFVVFVPLLQWFLFHRIPTRREIAGCIIAFLGMAVLVDLSGFKIHKSDLLLVISAFSYAIQILIVSSIAQSSRTPEFTAMQMATVATAATIACGIDGSILVLTFPSNKVLVAAAFTGIVASSIAYSLQTRAQGNVGPTEVAIIFSLEPALATLASIVFRRDVLTWRIIIGGGLIMAATVICTLPSFAIKSINNRINDET